MPTSVTALGGHDGTELAAAFDEIERRLARSTLRAADYAELFHAAIAERTISRPPAEAARMRIFGLLEARLQSVDRVVLGRLAEGIWPPETRGDPWLSRPMRHDLGLDLPERRIGLSAHDFAQMSRRAGSHSEPRRQTCRRADRRLALRAAAGRGGGRGALGCCARARRNVIAATGAPARRTAKHRKLRRVPAAEAAGFAARPRQLSVTEIEDLLRDPYTIYAKHVLDLAPLDAVDTAPGAADRGTRHSRLDRRIRRKVPKNLPADPVQAIDRRSARRISSRLSDYPEARAFWWPRFHAHRATGSRAFEAGRRAPA